MRSDLWIFVGIRDFLTYIFKIINNIFKYLTQYETETSNNRILLRRLYNSGYLDDDKYQNLCEKSSKDNLDPEELQLPM
jgi:hypothetical protein